MTHSLAKIFVVFVILIALVGQSAASATMSCESMMATGHSHTVMNEVHDDHAQNTADHNMHHGAHHDINEAKPITNDDGPDCCDTECVCPANACGSSSCLSTQQLASFALRSFEAMFTQPTAQTKAVSRSLYRPPIFA